MQKQNYYANFPSKLYQMGFKSDKDRNFHLLAMAYFVSFVHTGDGYFYISKSRLAKLIKCSRPKAAEILENLERWGYIEKQGEDKGQTVYKLSTYDFEIKENEAEKIYTQNLHPKLTPLNHASEQEVSSLSEDLEKQKFTPKIYTQSLHQTNNDITNNEITNNEIKINNEEEKLKNEILQEPLVSEIEVSEIQHSETTAEETTQPEPIKQTADYDLDFEIKMLLEMKESQTDIDKEFQKLTAIYPKTTGSLKAAKAKYKALRKQYTYEEIKTALDNYLLENEEVEKQYLKSLEAILDPIEIDPFLFKPVIAKSKQGQEFVGEFCPASNILRIKKDGKTIVKFLKNNQVEQMLEEDRLIFISKQQAKEILEGELLECVA